MKSLKIGALGLLVLSNSTALFGQPWHDDPMTDNEFAAHCRSLEQGRFAEDVASDLKKIVSDGLIFITPSGKVAFLMSDRGSFKQILQVEMGGSGTDTLDVAGCIVNERTLSRYPLFHDQYYEARLKAKNFKERCAELKQKYLSEPHSQHFNRMELDRCKIKR
jgi:hypothetical protein